MNRYLVTLTAVFEVEAENVMQAERVVRDRRFGGLGVGKQSFISYRGPHARAVTLASVRKVSETLSRPRKA